MKNLEFVEVNDSHLGRFMACINYVDGGMPFFETGLVERDKTGKKFVCNTGRYITTSQGKKVYEAGIYITHVFDHENK